jgi:hypothetical protein
MVEIGLESRPYGNIQWMEDVRIIRASHTEENVFFYTESKRKCKKKICLNASRELRRYLSFNGSQTHLCTFQM